MSRKAKKQKSRGVVDTNVLVAGISGFRKPYVRGKNPSADVLYKWAEKGNFVWLVTEDILDEYKEVLKRLRVRSTLIGGVINLIRERAEPVNVIKSVANTMESAFRNLPRTLRDTNVDALVLDEIQRGLGAVPLHLGMPYVHVSNALPFDFSGNTPVCTFDWQHETTPEALARNRAGVRSLLQTYEPITSVAHAYAKKVGLDVDWTDPVATISKLAWLTQMPEEFDFKISHWSAQFRYTGPFHDGLGRIESDFPWNRLTGERLIYASMGTLQNGLESVFTSIAEAVGTRPGIQLVLSIGPSLDPEKISSLPANSIVVKNAPQMELLKRSALCITHAGLNTALESLTQGVPMVAIPVSIDQPGVAARIAYTKTGAYVSLRELSTSRLSTLIDEVLGNPKYRQNANKMREAIVRTNGLEEAADLLEQAFNLSPKPLTSSIS